MNRAELDSFFARTPAAGRRRLGTVVGGSLSAGVQVKLETGDVLGGVIEDLAVGRYVVIEGLTGKRFFSLITDIALGHANPELVQAPPGEGDDFLREVYGDELAYGTVTVSPMLVLDRDGQEPKPVKTIPAHFAAVYEAQPEDVDAVFGGEDDTHFHVGTPLDMEEVKVNLDLKRFVERSSGVFGKSGTGKSFVTRTILSGVLKSEAAACLVFDMHNDYGWEVQNEHGAAFKGLRQLFGTDKVQVFTLDPDSSRARNSKFEGVLQIPYDQIDPEDVEMLAGILGLSEVQTGALFFLRRKLGRDWIRKLLSEGDEESGELTEISESEMIQSGTLRAIQRKFELFRRFGFLTERAPANDVVAQVFDLVSRGKSVVLEFGNYGNEMAAYVLVANYLTRRVHKKYVEAKNAAIGKRGQGPKPLMIVIEEAHKFLDPAIAQHTIFGTIARELRKYNVTLLIVDQRPSGIDDEVMSQIGTRVTCLLDNEADIRAVFSGVSGAGQLRQVLARLDTRQQALILGHAVPMPVVVKTRPYDDAFYRAIGWQDEPARREALKKGEDALWG
jgi:hypothetical protein